MVGYLNRDASICTDCETISLKDVQASELSRAMLFEVAVVVAEHLLSSHDSFSWDDVLSIAVRRLRRHFDARDPGGLSPTDQKVTSQVARNLVLMLGQVQRRLSSAEITIAPPVPGYRWISSSTGDFALGTTLVEVKCIRGNFSSADYRQIMIYWLLSYAGAVERRDTEWSHAVPMNPRRGVSLTIAFDDLIHLLSGGRSKVEVLEVFSTIIRDRAVER